MSGLGDSGAGTVRSVSPTLGRFFQESLKSNSRPSMPTTPPKSRKAVRSRPSSCFQISHLPQIRVIDTTNSANKVYKVSPDKKQVAPPLPTHKAERGFLRLRIVYNRERPGSNAQLTVKVVEARGLPAMDRYETQHQSHLSSIADSTCISNGLSDPYVRIFMGNERRKTATIKKTLDPVWNETFKMCGWSLVC